MAPIIRNKIEAFVTASNDGGFVCKMCGNCCKHPLIREKDFKKIKVHLRKILELVDDEKQKMFIEDQMQRYFPLIFTAKKWKRQCMFCQDDKCVIHGYAITVGVDYWKLKPFGCCMYPAQENEDGDIYISTHHCPPEYYKV